MDNNLNRQIMMSKQDLRRKFQEVLSSKPADMFRLGRDLHELLSFMESTIKKQFESFSLLSFSICGSEKRYKTDPQYETAFVSLSLEQQIAYFQAASSAIAGKDNQKSLQTIQNCQSIPIKAVKGIKFGQICKVDFSNYAIDCSNYQISLSKYILRKSKKHENMYIYEAIEKTEPSSIRFQLIANSQSNQEILFRKNYLNYKQYISQLANSGLEPDRAFKISKTTEKERERVTPSKHTILQTDNNFDSLMNSKADNDDRSVTHEILQSQEGFSEQIHELVQRKQQELGFSGKKRWSKNVAKIIVPHLSLVDVQNLNDCLPIHTDQVRRMYIYRHTKVVNRFVMQLHLRQPSDLVVKHLGQIQNYKLWHKSINESHIKLSISSDNAYIMYLKQKSYSEWFRQRDFLFLRHLCKVGSNYYFIDFSVQNSHFFPFQSIFRGVINHSIMKIQESGPNESRVVFQLQIDYGGLLPSEGKNQLTLAFLKGFGDLQSFMKRYKGGFKTNFDFNWEICLSNEQAQPTGYVNGEDFRNSNLFNQQLQRISSTSRGEETQQFYSIDDNQQKEPIYEITQEEIKTQRQRKAQMSIHQQTINVNEEGLIILPKNYLKIKHQITPFQIQQKKKQLPYSNLMIKQDFSVDKLGSLILTNKTKIAAQDNVIKFIMSTLKKNIFSGKGILNISLPVEIFNVDSNLQRVCQGLSFASDIIEKNACQSKDVQRFKQCVAFAFTNSVLYFDIQKPFNPILGETFQGFINGCPVYAEQISHHPPITSIYFVGRGFRIYGNLESKVYVHINSGDGVNQGFYTIQFNDGNKVLFQTCPGELSGLAVGDRKFRFKGKSYIIDAKNRLFCSLNFEDQSGIFSKNKWQYIDQIDGEVVRVKEQFIRKFFQTKQGKDAITPKQKDIEARLGKVNGRWVEALLIDGKEYFSLNSVPQEMVHYNFPLNSNSNYREDLYYRKLNDLARSQSEKERLEVVQRQDRKLREKYGPKAAKH